MNKKTLTIVLCTFLILVQPCVSVAGSDWNFLFFGINFKSFNNSNWMMVTAGAVTSVIVHEMGHALYLESQGKNWDLQTSLSGFSVHTGNHLSDGQYQNFGRAGFAMQTGIGMLLTLFDSTKHLDFTKGWVSMNVAQLYTYNLRRGDNSNDFDLIERGGGDPNLEYCSLLLLAQNNLLELKKPEIIYNSQKPDYSSINKGDSGSEYTLNVPHYPW